MGKVVVDMSVSLDGFVAGPRDRVGRPLGEGGEVLHRWLFAGERLSRYSHFFRCGSHPLASVPVFVLTHHPPQEVPRGHTPFIFVTDGIQAAIAQAQSAAGGKDVGVAGARTAQ